MRNTKDDNYVLQYEDNFYKWANIKIDPIKTENVNTEKSLDQSGL